MLVLEIWMLHVAACAGELFNFENGFAHTNTNPGSIALSFYSGQFSYSGW